MAILFYEKFVRRFMGAIFALGISFFWGGALADPRTPDNPVEPKVELDGKKDKEKSQCCRVSMINARGTKITGSLVLTADYIQISVSEKRGAEKKKIYLSTIETIEFLKWKGVEVGANEFVFYPSQIKFTLTDKSVIECGSNVKVLNKLTLMDGKKKHIGHTYFYDYWENDAWRGAAQPDKLYPETNPNQDTIVRIFFIR
jgi:hypothetical protein